MPGEPVAGELFEWSMDYDPRHWRYLSNDPYPYCPRRLDRTGIAVPFRQGQALSSQRYGWRFLAKKVVICTGTLPKHWREESYMEKGLELTDRVVGRIAFSRRERQWLTKTRW